MHLQWCKRFIVNNKWMITIGRYLNSRNVVIVAMSRQCHSRKSSDFHQMCDKFKIFHWQTIWHQIQCNALSYPQKIVDRHFSSIRLRFNAPEWKGLLIGNSLSSTTVYSTTTRSMALCRVSPDENRRFMSNQVTKLYALLCWWLSKRNARPELRTIWFILVATHFVHERVLTIQRTSSLIYIPKKFCSKHSIYTIKLSIHICIMYLHCAHRSCLWDGD